MAQSNVDEVLALFRDGQLYVKLPERELTETIMRCADGSYIMKWAWDRDSIHHETPIPADEVEIYCSQFKTLYDFAKRGANGMTIVDTSRQIQAGIPHLGIRDLTQCQLEAVAQQYLSEQYEALGQSPSYGELADALSLVSLDTLYGEHDGTFFVPEDFYSKTILPEPMADMKDVQRRVGDYRDFVLCKVENGDPMIYVVSQNSDSVETYIYDADKRNYFDGGEYDDIDEFWEDWQARPGSSSWLIAEQPIHADEWDDLVNELHTEAQIGLNFTLAEIRSSDPEVTYSYSERPVSTPQVEEQAEER